MPGNVDRLGGHVECLRRRRGDATGTELDTDPVNRNQVNVGTVRGRPSWAGGTSADGCGGDGVSVVVRDRESRSHGEGRQRDRRTGIGMPGGRR
jgi:hypothetical protein